MVPYVAGGEQKDSRRGNDICWPDDIRRRRVREEGNAKGGGQGWEEEDVGNVSGLFWEQTS